jgi:hypothetical protein
MTSKEDKVRKPQEKHKNQIYEEERISPELNQEAVNCFTKKTSETTHKKG